MTFGVTADGISIVIAAIALFFSVLSFLTAKRSTAIANKALELERKPFLSIRLLNAEQLVWDQGAGRVKQSGPLGADPVDRPFFMEIRNSGRSVALLTGVSRNWVEMPAHREPTPAAYPNTATQQVKIPVGPEGIVLASRSDGIIERCVENNDGAVWLFFFGHLEFTDYEEKETYVSGFGFVCGPPYQAKRGMVTAPLAKLWHYSRAKKDDGRGSRWRW